MIIQGITEMKNNNLKIWFISVIIVAIACSIGASSVSALSSDGESLLNGLVSAASSAGVDIDGIIDNYVSTTKPGTTLTVPAGSDPEADLDKILDKIGIRSDILLVTDLISYLNRGGSVADWIHTNYSKDIQVPDSVRAMSTKDIVRYLMDMLLYPEETKGSTETTTKQIFSTELTEQDVSSSDAEQTATESSMQEKHSETIPVVSYKTGDVDADGKVTAKDARLALRAGAMLDSLEGASFEAADVNDDGRITANDARSILRYSAKITSGF